MVYEDIWSWWSYDIIGLCTSCVLCFMEVTVVHARIPIQQMDHPCEAREDSPLCRWCSQQNLHLGISQLAMFDYGIKRGQLTFRKKPVLIARVLAFDMFRSDLAWFLCAAGKAAAWKLQPRWAVFIAGGSGVPGSGVTDLSYPNDFGHVWGPLWWQMEYWDEKGDGLADCQYGFAWLYNYSY